MLSMPPKKRRPAVERVVVHRRGAKCAPAAPPLRLGLVHGARGGRCAYRRCKSCAGAESVWTVFQVGLVCQVRVSVPAIRRETATHPPSLHIRVRPRNSLGLAAYIYSLDSSTTSYYLAFATSSFGKHSLISSIQVAQSIISAFQPSFIHTRSLVSSRTRADSSPSCSQLRLVNPSSPRPQTYLLEERPTWVFVSLSKLVYA